jgi:hypothetical protein
VAKRLNEPAVGPSRRRNPAEFAFIGAFVPAGRQVVELEFTRHWSHFLWLVVSLLALAGSIVLLVILRGGVESESPMYERSLFSSMRAESPSGGDEAHPYEEPERWNPPKAS